MHQSRTFLALALANSVSALLLPANPGRVATVHMAATEPAAKVFPVPAYDNLVLPYDTGGTNDNVNDKVNNEVNPFLIGIEREVAQCSPPASASPPPAS